MKIKVLTPLSIAVILWIIGSILLYKNGERNIAFSFVPGVIIVNWFITEFKKNKVT